MNPYRLALFMHVIGVIGFFMALGVYLFGIVALRRAQQAQQVRVLCQTIFATDAIAVGSILLVAIPGFYMARSAWGLGTSWVLVAIVSFALMAPIGPLLVERRLHAIAVLAAHAPDGELPQEIRQRIADPLIGGGISLMIALLLGIIYLMTTKPPLQEAILAIGVAVILGVAGGVPFWIAQRRQVQRVTSGA